MKRNKMKTADVEYYTELNFDLDLWEKSLGEALIPGLLKTINIKLRSSITARFAKQSGLLGKWPPLANITVALKGGDARILRYTGKLSGSFKSTIYGDELTISTDQPQARLLQYGGIIETTIKQSFWLWHNAFNKVGHPFKPRKLVFLPRPFLGFDSADVGMIRSEITKATKETERLGTYPL